MKISIIGYSGSGKSSFATKLSEKYHIVATYMDKYHFEPGWVERDTHLRNQMLEEVIKKDQWIIDGNYSKILKERFELADQIFIFNFNRFKCLYGALIRRIKYRNKTRRSMTEGNNEKLDLEFIIWILFKSRTKKQKIILSEFKRTISSKSLRIQKKKTS